MYKNMCFILFIIFCFNQAFSMEMGRWQVPNQETTNIIDEYHYNKAR
jgi:hypothetical protein